VDLPLLPVSRLVAGMEGLAVAMEGDLRLQVRHEG
jgi:hypothetical protein